MKLIDKIEEFLKLQNTSVSSWDIANALYDGCMKKPMAGNGIRIANIKMACYGSKNICCFVDDNQSSMYRWAGDK